jgi:carbamoyltransferase
VNILGVWDGHDSGAALLVDGRLAVAVNEERFTRRKLEVAFPARSIAVCLEMSGLDARAIDAVAVSTADVAKTLSRWLPFTKERYYRVRRRQALPSALTPLIRRAKYRMTTWPPNSLSRALSRSAVRHALARCGVSGARQLLFDHHLCHAFTAAHATGARSAAVLTIDGVGDGLSATTSLFRGNTLRRLTSSPAAHSLGVFFEHVTTLLNMRELEDEGKVMALAEYAAPVDDAANPLLDLIGVRDGRIHCAHSSAGLFRALRRVHWRTPNEQFAYMAQRTVEDVCVKLARDAVARSGEARLAIAGGVASNIKATRLIRMLPEVEAVHVFPHMGDGGLALGAAIACAHACGELLRLDFSRLDLGPSFTDDDVAAALAAHDLRARRPLSVASDVADLLARDRIVLWVQGGMEYGPRALGHRSVLARPDRPSLRNRLNRLLKRRVWYQPFCPSLLASEAPRILADWDGPFNPHMTTAYMVADPFRELMAGVTGVDGSCRPQIVPDSSPTPFAALLREVRSRIGAGVVLNTSLNIHGEPLVCRPAEAVDVYVRSGADALAIGPYLVARGCDAH